MKIQKIEFQNFRNFKDYGEITCSTDGRVTIIYGKNGDGKTTLHQLLHWVFYGTVHFNKTASDLLYNLEFEKDQSFNSVFETMGRIEFEHDQKFYSLTRKYIYRKGLQYSEKVNEEFTLLMRSDDYDWTTISKPREVIEKLLPSGLSEYFFFDGESMIADLRVKGKDSASKLRKALYAMFDLDVLEAAINHIGRTDLKTTVLGKLFLSKGTVNGNVEITAERRNIENAQSKLDTLTEQKRSAEERKAQLSDIIKAVSEQIGKAKSKEEYEQQRKNIQKQQAVFLKNSETLEQEFGEAIMQQFPALLISRAVATAQKRMHLKIASEQLPTGLGKALLEHLLEPTTQTCICGREMTPQVLAHLKGYYDLMPPRSYALHYSEFTTKAKTYQNTYNSERLEQYISDVISNSDQAASCDAKIKELDDEQKSSRDIEDLVETRIQAENESKTLEQQISNLSTEISKYEIYIKKHMKTFEELTSQLEESRKADRQIAIMKKVLEHFTRQLSTASESYSKQLEHNIQSLIDQMLTSKRVVHVDQEFAVFITDSHGSEAESEGQFAVVSFAYIGGILQMLQAEEQLSQKEYPLVLDGPFSKLDADQCQNVINTIPSFAPQVILFSKDDLTGSFAAEHIGRVWTITSNEEKNVAQVKEGFLWN